MSLPAPPPPEVRVADYLLPGGRIASRKRFRVKALRFVGGKLQDQEFDNTQEVVAAGPGRSVVRWSLSAGTATESYHVQPDGRIEIVEERSWQNSAIRRSYPATIAGDAPFREWAGESARPRRLTVRVVGRETVEAAGRTYQTVVFEVEDGMFRFKTWLAKGFGEVRSEVTSGPVRVSRRELIEPSP
ncbi:MAG: hypothetical protein FJZ00_03515 [Candidatus Sericytochromatia bacterium]|uniref:Uncharacterized protein n=1 Tax=Candidatus Tanganyikabacteria bacterium TaxID=2961651 RepID=A0A937X4G8_9BACT|nr:hypothetical protein [Candidatus Tanganyikabacteria bacterium]